MSLTATPTVRVETLLPYARTAVARWRSDYEAEVAAWYADGDGRPTADGGRGYRFPHCIHGTSLWTDYDNICGGCEGDLSDEDLAASWAHDAAVATSERLEWFHARPAGLSSEMVCSLIEWTFEPLAALEVK